MTLRYWEETTEEGRKREENIHLCVVELLHKYNQANRPPFFPKKTRKGVKEISTVVGQYFLKPRGTGYHEREKNKNKRRHTRTGNTHEQGSSTAAFLIPALSDAMTSQRGPGLSAKPEARNTCGKRRIRAHIHTYTHTHTDTCPRSIECIYHIENTRGEKGVQ